MDRSLGRADAGHEYGRADARPILWYGQRDFLPHPIPIEQLNLLGAMSRAQLLTEIPSLVDSRKPGGAFLPIGGPDDQHRAECTLVYVH
ncbi:hypothetical protein AYO43_06065 [Nitrospira sp. SCGC AG-212-E16]|nr:hypothetical protein AYO43_06065 [Nitrospira sp. SCGC AG-212-E16]